MNNVEAKEKKNDEKEKTETNIVPGFNSYGSFISVVTLSDEYKCFRIRSDISGTDIYELRVHVPFEADKKTGNYHVAVLYNDQEGGENEIRNFENLPPGYVFQTQTFVRMVVLFYSEVFKEC